MVCAELWLSFGSLIRAYAAAAFVNVDPALQVEINGDVICVRAGAALLEIRCDLQTGAGSWELRSAGKTLRHGDLQLLQEGRITMDGNALDFDHAAIDLIESLRKPALYQGMTLVVPKET